MATGGAGELGRLTVTIDADSGPFLRGTADVRRRTEATDRFFERAYAKRERRAERADDATRRREQDALKRSKQMARAALSFAYVVDDMQYGFGAIVNQIPQVVHQLTGRAGLAGGLAVLGVAINQMIKHWDTFGSMLSKGLSGGSVAQLERIAVRTRQAGEAFDEFMEKPGKEQAARVKAIQDAFSAAPGGQQGITKKLQALVAKGTLPELEPPVRGGLELEAALGRKGFEVLMQRYVKELDFAFPDAGRLREMARDALREEDVGAKVKDMMGRLFGAVFDQNAWDTLQTIVRKAPGVFDAETIKKIRQIRESPPVNLEKNLEAAGQAFGGPIGVEMMRNIAGLKAWDEGPGKGGKISPLQAMLQKFFVGGREGVDAAGVARNMLKLYDEQINAIRLQKGVTRQQAHAILLRETAEKAYPGLKRKGGADVMGSVEWGWALLHDGQEDMTALEKQQLAELKGIRQGVRGAERAAFPPGRPLALREAAMRVGFGAFAQPVGRMAARAMKARGRPRVRVAPPPAAAAQKARGRLRGRVGLPPDERWMAAALGGGAALAPALPWAVPGRGPIRPDERWRAQVAVGGGLGAMAGIWPLMRGRDLFPGARRGGARPRDVAAAKVGGGALLDAGRMMLEAAEVQKRVVAPALAGGGALLGAGLPE